MQDVVQTTPPKPTNDQKCGHCQHKFGMHFTTHDKTKGGCTYFHDDQRDGMYRCDCKGFAVVYLF